MIVEPPHLARRRIGLDKIEERRGDEHRRHGHLHRTLDRFARAPGCRIDVGEPLDLGSGGRATEGPRHQRPEVGYDRAALGSRVEPGGHRRGEDPPVRRRQRGLDNPQRADDRERFDVEIPIALLGILRFRVVVVVEEGDRKPLPTGRHAHAKLEVLRRSSPVGDVDDLLLAASDPESHPHRVGPGLVA